jgi:hypothetical protein
VNLSTKTAVKDVYKGPRVFLLLVELGWLTPVDHFCHGPGVTSGGWARNPRSSYGAENRRGIAEKLELKSPDAEQNLVQSVLNANNYNLTDSDETIM